MTTSRKSGSALLIVLGFLSFMVVSAVAFAIYMRAERMPSSALRRAVATRHLVHAALAEAIARVDDAVRGDPFPGLCNRDADFKALGNFTYRDGNGQAMDVWQGRVFMPPDPLGGTTTRETRFAPVTETVSVLTLEGLGYLPPGLVNDVRFLSRSSWAAQWQQLPFDAGRFAFCAVNVSDYFDVNRVWANRGRTSEAGCRLSLGYLFDKNFNPAARDAKQVWAKEDFQEPDARRFDQFVHTSRPDGQADGNTGGVNGSTTPYVSLLDYNLALGKNGSSSLVPLFFDWIGGSTKGNKTVYYLQGEFGEEAKSAARQPFVTESVSTNESWEVDLATAKGQPFYGLDMSRQNEVREIYKVNTEGFFKKGEEKNILSSLDLYTLYDYLDHDNVPLSLAMPCVERVPMVAALDASALKFELGPITPKTLPPKTESSTKITETLYEFDPQAWFSRGGGALKAWVLFPFKHGASRSGSFKVQAYLCAFIGPQGLPLRGACAGGLLPRGKAAWKEGEKTAFKDNVFLISACSEFKSVSLTEKEIQDEKEAGEMVEFFFHLQDVLPSGKQPFVTKIEEQNLDDNGNPTSAKPTTKWRINTRPYIGLKDNGDLEAASEGDLDENAFQDLAAKELLPYVCVWVRIVDEDDKTVDLVPACPQDDVFNDYDADDPLRTFLKGSFAGNDSDGVMPLLRFTGGLNEPFSLNKAVASFPGDTPTWTPTALYTVDPRFNWAPESWYETSESAEKWCEVTKALLESDVWREEGHDEDIFLFTSNQGILQSLGEFAFLPDLRNLPGDPSSSFGAYAARAEEALFHECAWTSYPIDRKWYATWAAQGVGRSTARECLVNPYTDDRAVMMAALANTPVDYWAAARSMQKDCALRQEEDGKLYNTADDEIDTAKEALKRAFCTQSEDDGDQLLRKDLVSIADQIMTEMRTGTPGFIESNMGNNNWNPATAWEDIWDNLPWNIQKNGNSVTKFLGIDLGNNVALHSVDRKFLYSYWRDCFANNQQLFLIFVRAESNALGGPGEGTPAQQGGRAVALVWRNPAATRQKGRIFDAQQSRQDPKKADDDREPHQTRVLFYHQFD